MKISYNWLQSYIEETLPEPEVLAEKIVFGAFEVEEREVIEHGDTVFEIKVLPDRAHDCLSHYGMAREVAGLLGLTLKPITFRTHESVQSDIKVSIETESCRRYIARKVFSVNVGPSPEWLKTRLESIGQRSINNIVDATNYIMFSFGQPIHAFDYDKLGSGNLIIRNAYDGEEMVTLDGKLVPLDPSMVVIANNSIMPADAQSTGVLALAGVKGGNLAEVDEHTKTIVIEVANFDPVMVRKTARKLNLLTDSAKRFENELTPHLAGQIIHSITDLIVDVAGGQPQDPIDDYPKPVSQSNVIFSTDYINQVLGITLDPSEIRDILNRYGYVFEEESELFKVLVPYERIDITGPHDMVEEIGRAYGYEKIESRLPSFDFTPTTHETFAKISAIKRDLVEKNYQEVYTYTFVKKGEFEVARGAVGKSALRKNLSDGLATAYTLNKQHADLLGISDMKIFEVGTVFPKSGEVIHVGIADNQGVREMTLDEYLDKNPLEINQYSFAPDSEKSKTFVMWSEFPCITRDIALWIPSETSPQEVIDVLKDHGTELLVREPKIFDTFSKDGKTSAAFRMVFQSFERTLTNEEVDSIMSKIYQEVATKGWEVR